MKIFKILSFDNICCIAWALRNAVYSTIPSIDISEKWKKRYALSVIIPIGVSVTLFYIFDAMNFGASTALCLGIFSLVMAGLIAFYPYEDSAWATKSTHVIAVVCIVLVAFVLIACETGYPLMASSTFGLLAGFAALGFVDICNNEETRPTIEDKPVISLKYFIWFKYLCKLFQNSFSADSKPAERNDSSKL